MGRLSPDDGSCAPPNTVLISWSKWSRTTAVRWYDWKASHGSTMSHCDVCSVAIVHILTLGI